MAKKRSKKILTNLELEVMQCVWAAGRGSLTVREVVDRLNERIDLPDSLIRSNHVPDLLETLPLHENSDDFLFDNEMLAQTVYFGFSVGEISCPTKYFPEASSITFRRSIAYGFGVLKTSLVFRLNRWGILRSPLFARTSLPRP